MIKGKDRAESCARHGNSVDQRLEPISLASEAILSLSEIKSGLIKVARFNGTTFFITNEGPLVSVYLHRASGAFKVNSIEIDGGIQTVKNTDTDILLVSSTGQEYSLIDNNFKVSRPKGNIRYLAGFLAEYNMAS